jgi:hypothetical protein
MTTTKTKGLQPLRAKLGKREILVPHPFRQPHRRNGWETTNLSPVLKERNFSPAEEKHKASGHDFSRADKTQVMTGL